MENQPDTCRRCGSYMPGCGYDPLCDHCVEEKANERLARTPCSAWISMECAPKDRPILACWGTAVSGAMGYDIVKHLRDEKWQSELCGDRYPADAFHLQGWMPLPSLPNAEPIHGAKDA